jgi:hypothetical protein
LLLIFSICGRLLLGSSDKSFFHFSLCHFSNLTISHPITFSYHIQPKTKSSAICFVLVLSDGRLLVCTANPSLSPNHLLSSLPHDFIVVPPTKIEKQKNWQTVSHQLSEQMVQEKKVEEVQIICFSLPSHPSSSTSDRCTFSLLLGGFQFSSPTIPSSTPSLSRLDVHPLWSNSNISSHYESPLYDLFLSFPSFHAPQSQGKDEGEKKTKENNTTQKDILIDDKFVGSTLQNCYFVKNVKIDQVRKVTVKSDVVMNVKHVYEG